MVIPFRHTGRYHPESVLKDAYQIRQGGFEGPFDLLLHLAERDKVDLYAIDISRIAEEYIAYINEMQTYDLDIASEFLLTAATLLCLKARMLLPDKAEADGGADQGDEGGLLIERLVEYGKYKTFARFLKGRIDARHGQAFLYREPLGPEGGRREVAGADLSQLAALYGAVATRFALRERPPSKGVVELVGRERVALSAKIREVLAFVGRMRSFVFAKAYSLASKSRTEVATAFLAILQLASLRRVGLRQDGYLKEIHVYRMDPAPAGASGPTVPEGPTVPGAGPEAEIWDEPND